MNIREASEQDWPAIWPIFHEIVKAGETYAYDLDTSNAEAKKIWLETPAKTYVFEENNTILGTYYLKTNQAGPGNHVCNCGYMVSSQARGKGLATKMCQHSQEAALALGYKAMQFNFVASSNEGAIRLWNKLGFDIVGRLPDAFKHPRSGYVDGIIWFIWWPAQPRSI